MNQKGFTLIELVLALAVGGMVMTAVMLSLYQIVWGSARTNDQVAALTDVNFATLWIKKDLQMAQETDLTEGNPPQSSVWLSWIDNTSWATANESTHSSNYSLSGTDLMRTYDGGAPRVVGRYISSIGFTQRGSVVSVNITATGPGVTKRDEPLLFSVLTHMRTEEVQ